jgi:hypothetical protein
MSEGTPMRKACSEKGEASEPEAKRLKVRKRKITNPTERMSIKTVVAIVF